MKYLSLITASALAIISVGCETQEISRDEEDTLSLGLFEDSTRAVRSVTLDQRVLNIDGTHGRLSIEGVDDATTHLTFTKYGRGATAQEATDLSNKIQIDEVGDVDSYTYSVRTPRRDLSRVTMEGTVPRATSLNINLINGPTTLDGLDGPVSVRLANGSVEVNDFTSDLDVQIRNGTIVAVVRELRPNGRVRLVTNNGDVHIKLPVSVSARIDGRTSAGVIKAARMPFTQEKLDLDGAGGRFVGRLGTGEASIELITQNGSIIIDTVVVKPRVGRTGPESPADPASEPDVEGVAPDTTSVPDEPRTPADESVPDNTDMPSETASPTVPTSVIET